jgi:hypothetical protein
VKLKKVVKESLLQQQQLEFGIKRFLLLYCSEFDKLGLRVGEKHILEVLKADQNIGKKPMFLNAAGILIA